MEYAALFDPAPEGGFVITFPDIGYGATQGETEEDAREMAEDFLASALWDLIRSGKELPRPKKYRGRNYRLIRPSVLIAAKLQLYSDVLRSGIRKSDLARKMGISKTNVDRLFDIRRNSQIEQIELAFHALGKTLVISVEDQPTAA